MAEAFLTTNYKEFEKSIDRTIEELQQAGEMALQDLAKRGLRLYRGTTRNWQRTVTFDALTEVTSDGLEILIGTDDKIYNFLDRGTRVRRALMSPDWQSKTSPGSLRSGTGRGHVVFISKKLSLPGIKARKFGEQITTILEREVEPTFNRHLKKVK